ncbi:MAG TPA: hypothetical protein VHZ07_27060 [Bryobacteraceae bacterium]|jgi:hypothetical protein|nr:hypothetical protein [Bryobacteraceae bacterium]
MSVRQHKLRITLPLHLRPLTNLQLLGIGIVQELFNALLFLFYGSGEISILFFKGPYLGALGLQGLNALGPAKHDGGVRRKRDQYGKGSNRA